MFLQAFSLLKYSLTLNKSLAKWSLLNPAKKWIRGLELNQKQRAWQILSHLNCVPGAASSVETNKPHCFRGKKYSDKQLSPVKSITFCHDDT